MLKLKFITYGKVDTMSTCLTAFNPKTINFEVI